MARHHTSDVASPRGSPLLWLAVGVDSSAGGVAGVTGAGAMLIGAVAYASLSRGAFYGDQFVVLVVWCGVTLGFVRWAGRGAADWLGVAVALGFGAVLWVGTLVSALAAGAVGGALPALGMVGVMAVALVVGSQERYACGGLADGLCGCALVVAASAWFGVAFHYGPWGLVVDGLWRGASVITYTNAAASFMAMMMVVGVGRLACAPCRWSRLVVWGLAVGLALTMSRAASAAALVGLAVVAVGVGWRPVGRSLASVLPGAVIAVCGVVPGLHVSSGPRPFAAIAGLGLGVVAVWVGGATRVAAVVLVACSVVVAVVAFGGGVSDSVPGELARSRFIVGSDDRIGEWGAAIGEFADRPVTGQGPGQAEFVWEESDGRWLRARFAHNEYLELLASQGVVGFSALIVALGLLVYGWRRAMRAVKVRSSAVRGCRVGMAGALVVFAVHSAFDFLWHIPLVGVVAALLAGCLLGFESSERPMGTGTSAATSRHADE